jgi:hypothetical protein
MTLVHEDHLLLTIGVVHHGSFKEWKIQTVRSCLIIADWVLEMLGLWLLPS